MKLSKMLDRLQEARRAAKFERAAFRLGPQLGVTNDKDTKDICEATRIYRDTWIIAPLDEVIAEVENELNRRKRPA